MATSVGPLSEKDEKLRVALSCLNPCCDTWSYMDLKFDYFFYIFSCLNCAKNLSKIVRAHGRIAWLSLDFATNF